MTGACYSPINASTTQRRLRSNRLAEWGRSRRARVLDQRSDGPARYVQPQPRTPGRVTAAAGPLLSAQAMTRTGNLSTTTSRASDRPCPVPKTGRSRTGRPRRRSRSLSAPATRSDVGLLITHGNPQRRRTHRLHVFRTPDRAGPETRSQPCHAATSTNSTTDLTCNSSTAQAVQQHRVPRHPTEIKTTASRNRLPPPECSPGSRRRSSRCVLRPF